MEVLKIELDMGEAAVAARRRAAENLEREGREVDRRLADCPKIRDAFPGYRSGILWLCAGRVWEQCGEPERSRLAYEAAVERADGDEDEAAQALAVLAARVADGRGHEGVWT